MAGRLGVFVCHCGVNIAGTVDVAAVAAGMAALPGVAIARDYVYMCSEPGQRLIRESVAETGLDGFVVACCTPTMHETTFRKAAGEAGVNPFRCEIANIREQCAWVHQKNRAEATRKAAEIIEATLAKLRDDRPLEPIVTSARRRVLVVGAGVAGLTAALDMADGGYPVVLVEREPVLGGRLLRLHRTFPTDEPVAPLIGDLAERAARHPLITIHAPAEVTAVEGYVGNFAITVVPRLADTAAGGTAVNEEVGAIILATGAATYPLESLGEYGGGTVPDVIDATTFEELLARAEGAPGEGLRRPSDNRPAKHVVFVQCAGARDPERHRPYCSRICCMVTARQARQFRRLTPGGQATVFYMDLRCDAKGYEEYLADTMAVDRVLYVRGRVSGIHREGDRLLVGGVDTVAGGAVEARCDLVVLATPLVPAAGSRELAERMRATADVAGFLSEAHIKLYPVESSTRGIYLAGCAQGPKDIPDSVMQASAAAGKARALLAAGRLSQDPLVAVVDIDVCSGCGICEASCPYGARERHPRLAVFRVREALCQGCGACAAACPNKATELCNAGNRQVLAMVGIFAGGRP